MSLDTTMPSITIENRSRINILQEEIYILRLLSKIYFAFFLYCNIYIIAYLHIYAILYFINVFHKMVIYIFQNISEYANYIFENYK